MRFLHLADLHLGKQLNGFSLAEDQAYILKQIVALACEHHVDTILIAGDIYDRALPSADAVELLDTFLTNLGAAGINVVAIPGNHDSAQRVAYGSALLAAQNIYLAKPYTGTLCPITFTDKYGDVVIWPIPFMRPAHIRPYHSDGEFGSNYSAALETNTIVNITNIKACRQPANKSKYRCKGTGITNCKNGIDTLGINVDINANNL